MASPSATLKTAAHAHPLLADDLTGSSKGRRKAGQDEHGSLTSQDRNNYFALRAQLENPSNDTNSGANWDGSVRGKSTKRKSM